MSVFQDGSLALPLGLDLRWCLAVVVLATAGSDCRIRGQGFVLTSCSGLLGFHLTPQQACLPIDHGSSTHELRARVLTIDGRRLHEL